MGSSNSKKYERLPGYVREHSQVFEALGLQHGHILKLFKVFHHIDRDGSKEVSLGELLDHLKLRKTPFTVRAFSIFDEDRSGEISFKEFVLSLYNYCTLSKASLVLFAFDLYDEDSSGSMELTEMTEMCKDVYGGEYHKNRLAMELLDKIDKMAHAVHGSGDISIDRFSQFCQTHPSLLYPAFAFQMSLRKKILGFKFWESLAQNRITLPSGYQASIMEILNAHVDKHAFTELAQHDQLTSRRLSPEMKKKINKSKNHNHHHSNENEKHEFMQVFEQTGTVAKRRIDHQKIKKSLSVKLKAASALQAGSTKNAFKKGENGEIEGIDVEKLMRQKKPPQTLKVKATGKQKPGGASHIPQKRKSLTVDKRALSKRNLNIDKTKIHPNDM